MLEESKKIEASKLVNGLEAIEAAKAIDVKKEEDAIMAEARLPLAKGKMGKKEMGQQKVNRP